MTQNTARNTYRLALLLAGLSAIGPFSFDTFLPAMPSIAHSLKVGPIEIQQALTVYMLSFGTMTLWHGALSDALGRRPIILGGMLVFTIASFACASQVTMLFSLAPAIAPVVGGWLFTAFNWRAILIFMALFGLLLFVACWFTLDETYPAHKRTSLALHPLLNNYLHIGRTGQFGLMSAAVACNFAGFFIYIPSTPVFLIQHLSVSPQGFLILFGPVVGGIMLVSWLSGRMAGRRGPYETIRLGYVVMFAAMLINLGYSLFFPPALLHCILPLAIYTTGMALSAPSITIILMDQFPHLRGTASSLQGFSQAMLNAAVVGAIGVICPLVWGSTATLALAMMGFLLVGFRCYWWYGQRLVRISA